MTSSCKAYLHSAVIFKPLLCSTRCIINSVSSCILICSTGTPRIHLDAKTTCGRKLLALFFLLQSAQGGMAQTRTMAASCPMSHTWVQLHQTTRFREGSRRKDLDVNVKAPTAPGRVNPRVSFTPKRKKGCPEKLIPTASRFMEVSDDEVLGQRGGWSRRRLQEPYSACPSLGWTTGQVSELLPMCS